MVFKDAISGAILLTKFVTHETVSEYKAGVDEIIANGTSLSSCSPAELDSASIGMTKVLLYCVEMKIVEKNTLQNVH